MKRVVNKSAELFTVRSLLSLSLSVLRPQFSHADPFYFIPASVASRLSQRTPPENSKSKQIQFAAQFRRSIVPFLLLPEIQSKRSKVRFSCNTFPLWIYRSDL